MGSASSRMSASPTLIQTYSEPPRTSHSTGSHVSPRRQSRLGLKLERSDSVPTPASAPTTIPYLDPSPSSSKTASKDAMAAILKPTSTLDPKGKGKQKALDDEKEEGEISEEDEGQEIQEIDSWRPPAKVWRLHHPSNTARHQPRQYSRHSETDGPARDSQSSTGIAISKSLDRGSLSNSPVNLCVASPSSHRHSMVSEADTTTSSTPSSDSLALPESVNLDEAAQYMDIIRNLITDGISPDALIKRGATRKYVLAVCKDLANLSQLDSVDTQNRREDDGIINDNSIPSLLHDDSPNAIEMTRKASCSSSGSLDVNDAIDKMLSPPQRPVPSSSWKPNALLASTGLTDKPLLRTDTYKPGYQASPSTIRVPSQLSASAAPFSLASLPRPVSSYVPSGPRADLLLSRTDGPGRGTSSSTATLRSSQFSLPSSSAAQPSAGLDPEVSPSPAPGLETLAERKKRVLESMKRARKLNVAASSATNGPSVPQSAPEGDSTPSLTTAQEAATINADFENEVAALEREVMGLQDAKPYTRTEVEEGEITPPTAPAPETLPVRATLNLSTASTNHVNGVRLNRASKRPHAEDLMEKGSTYAKPIYPVRKRPFGRPIPYQYLLVRLDDSDDEKESRPARKTQAASDADRLRLEEDIKRLKARIEERRLAKIAKAKSERPEDTTSAVSDSPREPKLEPADEVMEIDEDEAVVAEPMVLQAPQDLHQTSAQTVIHSPRASTITVGDTESKILKANTGSSPASDAIMTPQASSETDVTMAADNSPASTFRAYRSILRRYPLLPIPGISTSANVTRSPSVESGSGFDPELMASIILTNVNKRDPNAVMCGAEAAGGICADRSCSDLHFGRELVRPDDGSIIEYLDQIKTGKHARNILKSSLARAKRALGPILDKDIGGNGAPIAKDKLTTFSLPVAERLVALVEQSLQDDE